MKSSRILLLFITTLILPAASIMGAEMQAEKIIEKPANPQAFESFTGKVSRNKVRLRLQPSTDAYVLRELNQNDLLVITGQNDDFYAVQPPKESKGYIFRTYVLDNVIEGNRVNVRLKPDLESPIITQMSSGDKVTGSIDASNPKWLEISLPPATRFYVAKDYVEKVGDANMLARIEKRREESDRLLNTTYTITRNEMNKPFDQIHIEGATANYKKIISEYSDIPEAASRANVLLSELQNNYTNKKLAYLESQTHLNAKVLETQNKTLTNKIEDYQRKLSDMENMNNSSIISSSPNRMPANMSIWIPVEQTIISRWSGETLNNDSEAFYKEQEASACTLRGLIEPYNRPVKNRPGDFLLVNSHSKLPIAFLYSTKVNIQNYVGHDVVVRVVPRPNNNYAFPAYYVLTIE